MNNELFEKLAEKYTFITLCVYASSEYVGIIQNQDDAITTIYDFGSIQDREIKKKFLEPESDDMDDASSNFKDIVDGGGWQGWHCEGRPIITLFGLLMWDIIFADISGVFISPYQDRPLDIFCTTFYCSR